MVAQGDLEVKAVGTVSNVADLGTKPLPKARVNLLLHWCQIYNGDGERIGQEEYHNLEERAVSKSKIQRLAKLLNRILLLEGLEHVAGERGEGDMTTQAHGSSGWTSMLIVILFMVIGVLILFIYKLWRKLERMEARLQSVTEDEKVNGMMIGAYGHEAQEGLAKLKNYVQRVHRGLIKASGYVDDSEFGEEDWKHWNYIEDTNREFDMRRLDGQIKSYLKANAVQTRLHLNVRDNTLIEAESEGEDHDPDDEVQVRLDSGEIITVRARDVQPREPESEEEGPTPMEEDEEERPRASRANPSEERRYEDPTMSMPTTRWLTDAEMQEVMQYDTPGARSCLRAKQYALQFERRWFDLNQRSDHEQKMEMYSRMDKHMPFLDSDQVPW